MIDDEGTVNAEVLDRMRGGENPLAQYEPARAEGAPINTTAGLDDLLRTLERVIAEHQLTELVNAASVALDTQFADAWGLPTLDHRNGLVNTWATQQSHNFAAEAVGKLRESLVYRVECIIGHPDGTWTRTHVYVPRHGGWPPAPVAPPVMAAAVARLKRELDGSDVEYEFVIPARNVG